MELEVFDLSLNNLGIIDVFEEAVFEIFYDKISTLTLTVVGNKKNIELLAIDNILTKSNDLDRGYIIKHFAYTSTKKDTLVIYAYSLNTFLSWRIVLGQQRYYGNAEDVIKAFVNANAINPTNPNRIITKLGLAENQGIDIVVDESTTGDCLSEYCYKLTAKHEMSWDILINHNDKSFNFTTWQGTDRSGRQEEVEPVVFSRELDNLLTNEYVRDEYTSKTTAIVAGEGEGVARTQVIVNDEISGFNRKELYVDARDLQSTYRENDKEVTLPESRYKALLQERGKNKLTEYQVVETMESETKYYSQYTYGVDYLVGDIVTIEEEKFNLVMHTRLVGAKETYNRQGVKLQVSFGNNIPTLLDRIKREVS